MDQESDGQRGQASESQPEVHGPLSGVRATRGARLWAFVVSDVPGRPSFPKRGSPSGERVKLMGNSIRVRSKFALDLFFWKDSRPLFFLYPCHGTPPKFIFLMHIYKASEEDIELWPLLAHCTNYFLNRLYFLEGFSDHSKIEKKI